MSWATSSVRSIPFFFFTGVSKVSTDSFMWETCLTSKGQRDSSRYFLGVFTWVIQQNTEIETASLGTHTSYEKQIELGCAVRFIHFQFPGIAKTCQAVNHVLKIICWLQQFVLVGSVIAEGWVLHSFLQQNFK